MTNNKNNINKKKNFHTHTQKEKQTARADDSIMDDKLFVMMFVYQILVSSQILE